MPHNFALRLSALLLVASPLAAQSRDVTIEPTKLADGVYMLTGSGGNMGLSVGEDGAFLIDDQFPPLTGKILAAVESLAETQAPVRFVINTHWHGDHTGGNENLAGTGAVIVAHENVRRRMSAEQLNELFQRATPPSPPAARPVVTFADAVTFHWNGDEVRVFHVDPAHTDGDSIVHFRQANVVHMGDTYFSAAYPFIDTSSGGTMDGMIRAAERVLEIADAETKIIPGHGPLAGRDDLRAYRDMLVTVRDRVAALIAEGRSRDEVIAAGPTLDLDETWGGSRFMPPEVWVGVVFDAMAKKKAER